MLDIDSSVLEAFITESGGDPQVVAVVERALTGDEAALEEVLTWIEDAKAARATELSPLIKGP